MSTDDPREFFVAEFSDVPYRDQRDTMERPFFSLSKNPRFKPIEYQVSDTRVRVTAHPEFGMATIWDVDILIWAATQIREALDRNQPTGPVLKFHAHELLKGIGRGVSGKDYQELRAAFRRLAGTLVQTNVRMQNRKREKEALFHWLEAWTDTTDNEGVHMTMTLPKWFYDGIVDATGVLTIHEDYFQLTGGLDRWLYRVARKHAGQQLLGWQFTMRQLYEKSGSPDRFANFAIAIRRIIERDELPEYTFEAHRNGENEEIISITPREVLAIDDPRRNPRRRFLRGIYSSPLRLPE